MPTVIALRSFEHYGPRRRNEEFSVSEAYANELVRAGLVRIKQDSGDRELAKPAPRSKGRAKK